jgi:tRNA dimethylallyltransferase
VTLTVHPLIVVLGPTGSGKSALALALAAGCHGEIVNCDSLQIYREFDIGTAKTPPEQRAGIPHHLFDIITANVGYSAGEYARTARVTVAEVTGRGSVPVIVGGTGFYLRALLSGLPPLPDRDEKLRARLAAREERRPGSLHRILTRLDPAAGASIHHRDVQKSIRALEIRLLTRTPRPHVESTQPLEGYRICKIGLDPDRAELNRRLDERVIAMFGEGLCEEVRGLLAGGLTGNEKPFESLGYKQALAHVRGTMTIEEAIASTQLQTRQYAKRQRTWFRREIGVHWIEDFGDSRATLEKGSHLVSDFLQQSPHQID